MVIWRRGWRDRRKVAGMERRVVAGEEDGRRLQVQEEAEVCVQERRRRARDEVSRNQEKIRA
jgi:hypothetical protein